MPELPEIRISSDFINQNCKDRIFNKIYAVEKGNEYIDITKKVVIDDFAITSKHRGKELSLFLGDVLVSVFMGMSGNWCFCKTTDIDQKFIRLRLDSSDGHSLLLHGGYMGPQWRIGRFENGTKRGPDPTLEYDDFKNNILSNLDKSLFNKPVYEVLLNQEYFSGVGNYIRSTILYYLNDSPFQSARDIIKKHGETFFNLCKEVPLTSYKLNGGQLKDWKNPMNKDSEEFQSWVFYKKGDSLIDANKRTFWYDPKWIKVKVS